MREIRQSNEFIEILRAINRVELTLLDLGDVVKVFEDKFGGVKYEECWIKEKKL